MRTTVTFSTRHNFFVSTFLIAILFYLPIQGQVGMVGLNTSMPRATLDVVSQGNTNVGIVLPRVSDNNHLSNSEGNLAMNDSNDEILLRDLTTQINLLSLNDVSELSEQLEDLENSLENLSTTSLQDLKIYGNDLYFRDPADPDYWLSLESELLIFSVKGGVYDDWDNKKTNLSVANNNVEDDTGYYIAHDFAIIRITASDADGESDREIRLRLQNNLNSNEEGVVIFEDTDVDNRAESWTSESEFTRNNSAGRLLAQAKDEGGRRGSEWADPIITVEVKKRIQIP